MKLGHYDLGTPVFLAPLAGVTDKAFRETVRAAGGEYTWSEMISAKALTYRNTKTLKMLELSDEPEPRIVQLFGSEPETMAEAAQLAVASGADVIDINMGCPMQKIVKNGEGAALLKDRLRAGAIASAVVEAVKAPVTVKMRLGWDGGDIAAVDFALALEAAGVQMLTVHGRTREQFYAGRADWEWIRRVKEKVSIPVIGNGDVFTPEDAAALIGQTNCDGVMIGRAACGNPWIIARTQCFLNQGCLLAEPPLTEQVQTVLEHFARLLRDKGERIGLNEMRKHAVWYSKGLRNAAQLRDRIMQAKSVEEMRSLLETIGRL